MTHATIFSGIGAAEIAAQSLGWRNLFNCDNNEFAQRVLKYHFPDATQYGGYYEYQNNQIRIAMKTPEKQLLHEETVSSVISTLGEWGASFDHQAFEDFFDDYDIDTMIKIHHEVGRRMIQKEAEIFKVLFPRGVPKQLRDRIYKLKNK